MRLLDRLVDIIGSNPAVDTSIVSILGELLKLISLTHGMPNQVTSPPPVAIERTALEKNKLRNLVKQAIKRITDFVWDNDNNELDTAFTFRLYIQENISITAHKIQKHVNSPDGRKFDDSEWISITETETRDYHEKLKIMVMTIMKKALIIRKNGQA